MRALFQGPGNYTLLFTAVLTGLLYPIAGSWKWGQGWLHIMEFQDFAGSTHVHSVSGWAALNGALAGIWGTMIEPLARPHASFIVQAIGLGAYGAFTIIVSAFVWLAMKLTFGIRVQEEDEYLGLEKAEIGVEAYPEFASGRVY